MHKTSSYRIQMNIPHAIQKILITFNFFCLESALKKWANSILFLTNRFCIGNQEWP